MANTFAVLKTYMSNFRGLKLKCKTYNIILKQYTKTYNTNFKIMKQRGVNSEPNC